MHQLIEQINKDSSRGNDYSLPFRKINFDEKLDLVLASQQVNLTTILPKEKTIQLAFNSNVSTGGLPYEKMCFVAAG